MTTIQQRINTAKTAIRSYSNARGNGPEEWPTDAGDLIADVLHWLVNAGYDLDEALDRARMHIEAELEEEGIV